MAASPYRVLLGSPAIRWQAIAGLLAQTTQGAAGIGIILVVHGHGRSLALAGAVVGALSVAAGLGRPVQGRLIDRRGARNLMAACGVVHAAALAALVALADTHAPGPLLVGVGAIAGLTLPPVSTCMRVAWGAAAADSDRTSAYSLVYLTQELSILAGPLLLAALITATDASVALVTVAAVACAGTLGFAASLPGRTQADATSALGPASAQRRDSRWAPGRGGAVLRAPGVRVLMAAAALVGAVIGGLEVAVPTFATAHRAPAASGLLIALLAIGGIAGAAIYGSHRWRLAPAARLLVLLAWLSLAVAVTLATSGLVALGAVLVLVGLALNPSLTTISLLVDQHVSPANAAEAFGWLSCGIAAGTGAANAIAGALSAPRNPLPAFEVAIAAAVLGTLLVACARRMLARAPG